MDHEGAAALLALTPPSVRLTREEVINTRGGQRSLINLQEIINTVEENSLHEITNTVVKLSRNKTPTVEQK